MSLIDNERTKLLANALDRASTACFTVGIITPFAGYAYGFIDFSVSTQDLWPLVPALGWLMPAIALHLFARRVMGGLRQ